MAFLHYHVIYEYYFYPTTEYSHREYNIHAFCDKASNEKHMAIERLEKIERRRKENFKWK